MSATTINEVFADIFTATTYNNTIKNFFYTSSLRSSCHLDDVKQDVMMYLLNVPEKVIQLYNKGQLIYFFTSICQKQIRSGKSKVFGRYGLKQQKESELFESAFEDIEELSAGELEELEEQRKYFAKQKLENLIQFIEYHREKSQWNKVRLEVWKAYHFEKLVGWEIAEKQNINMNNVYKYLREANVWVEQNFKNKPI